MLHLDEKTVSREIKINIVVILSLFIPSSHSDPANRTKSRQTELSQCKNQCVSLSQWSPQHQGVSCEQYRQLQLQNQPDLQNFLFRNSIGKHTHFCTGAQLVCKLWNQVMCVFVCILCRVSKLSVCVHPVSGRLPPLHLQPMSASVLRRLQSDLHSWSCESSDTNTAERTFSCLIAERWEIWRRDCKFWIALLSCSLSFLLSFPVNYGGLHTQSWMPRPH